MTSGKKPILMGACLIAGLCTFVAMADIGPFSGRTPDRTALLTASALTGTTTPVTSVDGVSFPTISLTRQRSDTGQIVEADGILRTNLVKPTVVVRLHNKTGKSYTQPGRLVVLVNGTEASFETLYDVAIDGDGQDGQYRVNLEPFQNSGEIRLSARWVVEGHAPDDPNKKRFFSTTSKSITVEVDTRGPSLQTIDLDEDSNELRLKFETDSLKASGGTPPAHYIVHQLDGDLSKQVHPTADKTNKLQVDGPHGAYVILKLGSDLGADGDYAIHISPAVTDTLGNPAGQREIRDGTPVNEEQLRRYSIFGERPTGPHVEFPDFLERQRVAADKVFNPGDSVETRVVRLYYYRDAHRVAQILNRNVQQFNKAGVDRAVRTAGQAREAAEHATDERKRAETVAIEAAGERRSVERDLRQAERALEERRSRLGRISTLTDEIARLQDEIARLTEQIGKADADLADIESKIESEDDNARRLQLRTEKKNMQAAKQRLEERKKTFEAAKNQLESEKNLLESAIKEARERVTELKDELKSKQVEEAAARRKMDAAETREDRAVEHQFRAEVAAAKEDPDTYVPAKLDSVDAVTQVSISVIGEGLIQLRGPIRGINTIRTMINQIDSPVGQVKVGIFTVQVNGEHGDRMEDVATEVEGHIDLSRFLTNYSLALIRRSVQEVAARTIHNIDAQFTGHHQSDRDRRYVYAFFGRDFVDELFEMDSEFLRTENKLLSLHSMDTVSQSQAMFILALAKNDVRQDILDQFMMHVDTEIPQAEWDFRQAAELKTKKMKKAERLDRLEEKLLWRDTCGARSLREVANTVQTKYRYRNLRGFFTASRTAHSDAMTPLQREFIRLAQIFKSTMLAEMELKQRIVERGLIQQYTGDPNERVQRAIRFHREAEETLEEAERERHDHATNVANAINKGLIRRMAETVEAVSGLEEFIRKEGLRDLLEQIGPEDLCSRANKGMQITIQPVNRPPLKLWISKDCVIDTSYREGGNRPIPPSTEDDEEFCDCYRVVVSGGLDSLNQWQDLFRRMYDVNEKLVKVLDDVRFSTLRREFLVDIERGYFETLKYDVAAAEHQDHHPAEVLGNVAKAVKCLDRYRPMVALIQEQGLRLREDTNRLTEAILNPAVSVGEIEARIDLFSQKLFAVVDGQLAKDATWAMAEVEKELRGLRSVENEIQGARYRERAERVDLDHKKLLDFLIDEKREKWIELAEGTRSHIASVDNYLKRLSIALEDDFKVQFYDPAFRGVRGAARTYDVSLGQVERTTILTNNRALAVVRPQATMEFDLPKRGPVIVEAMNGAQALMQDYGTLLQDPTFVGLTGMLSGTPVVGNPQERLGSAAVRTVVPGLDSQTNDEIIAQSGGPNRQLGSAIENLIPEPAIYKFETGTGFQIRPVIQPDGHSVIYNFNYMYTTNVREPVAADEKHLGRIKRHFIDTEVQTSSFELREISRYQVALKASRTSRGVPLLEDVPGVGVLFRPLPSDESSLQQNIILGHTTVYPTLFDLMGLRWSRHVADLDHLNLRDSEHVIRGRQRVITDYVFDRTSSEVDDFLDIRNRKQQHHRPDLYHPQSTPSPYHPGGHTHQRDGQPLHDPTGRNFHREDPRPTEYQHQPAYDSLHGGPLKYRATGREVLPSIDRIPMAPQNSPSQETSNEQFSVPAIPPSLSTPSPFPIQPTGFARPNESDKNAAIQNETQTQTQNPKTHPVDDRPITPDTKKRSLLSRLLGRGGG